MANSRKSKESFEIKQFTPLWDNIIVRPIKITEKNGFRRPQNEEDKSELGEIVSIGKAIAQDGAWKDVLHVGDIVLFNKYSSTKIDLGEELIVRAEDIVAIAKANAKI